MKNIRLLLGLVTLVVIMASCATMQGTSDDGYIDGSRTQQIGNRLYIDDPYYGNVVLERDPYTGRYYDVTYGSRFGSGFYGYPYRGGYRIYRNNGGVYRNNGNVYKNNNGGTRPFGNNTVIQSPQRPSREQLNQNREAARNKILGKQ